MRNHLGRKRDTFTINRLQLPSLSLPTLLLFNCPNTVLYHTSDHISFIRTTPQLFPLLSAQRPPTLQIHLLAIAERVAALGAPGAGRVEVVGVAGLQHLPTDVALAVGALDAVLGLVVLLAVWLAISGGWGMWGVSVERNVASVGARGIDQGRFM